MPPTGKFNIYSPVYQQQHPPPLCLSPCLCSYESEFGFLQRNGDEVFAQWFKNKREEVVQQMVVVECIAQTAELQLYSHVNTWGLIVLLQ